MNQDKTITLLLKGKTIKVDARLSQFSKVLEEADQTEPIDINMMTEVDLKNILEFYQSYGFVWTSESKIVSNSLETNLGSYSDFFKKFADTKESNEIALDKIKGLLEACYHYDFTDLKELCLTAIASTFYYNNKNKNNSKSDISNREIPPQEYIQIINKYKDFLVAMEGSFNNDPVKAVYEEYREENWDY